MTEITLCMVVHNQWQGTKKAIDSAKEIVSNVFIIDQDSNKVNARHLRQLADIYIRRSCKGYADPDRQYLYDSCPTKWILALDSDEYLSKELKDKIPEMVFWPYDIFWIKFKNLVNGKNIQSILGDDFHPRLFKKGSLVWSEKAHTFPQAQTPRQYFCDLPIIHNRKMKDVLNTYEQRSKVLDPQNVALEQQFIGRLKQLLEGTK